MGDAMWEIVGGDDFSVSGNDYGAGLMLQTLGDYSGPETQLIALSEPAQDYLTPLPMSDGWSTSILFAMAMIGLSCIHRVGAVRAISANV
jgi:hypothetical protein